MLDTSLVLTAGMLALTASEFTGFLYLGGFTAWSVLAALVTDLFLLGPLLVVLEDRPSASNHATPTDAAQQER